MACSVNFYNNEELVGGNGDAAADDDDDDNNSDDSGDGINMQHTRTQSDLLISPP